jgi:hypothetical protein
MDIIDRIDLLLPEEVKAKRETTSNKQYADKYYRLNRDKVLRKKKELAGSAEGKIRKRMKPIMKKGRKTPTGRHTVSYNK